MEKFTDRQIQIIETAVELISKKGIQNLTIKNLSKKIGVTEPAIYRHFKNKEGILCSMLLYFKSKIDIKFPANKKNMVSQLEQFFLKHIEILSKHPAFSLLLFSEETFQNNRKIFKQTISLMGKEENAVLDFIRKGQSSRDIRNDISDKHLAYILIGAIRLLIKKWYLSNFEFNLENEFIQLWKSLEKILIEGVEL